jgi:cell wall-associated NlpC family hydrolase
MLSARLKNTIITLALCFLAALAFSQSARLPKASSFPLSLAPSPSALALATSPPCPSPAPAPETSAGAESLSEALARNAIQFLGRYKISVGEKRFTNDCSGTVRAILYAAGVRIESGLMRFPARSATQSLYYYFESQGCLVASRDLRPGDILFWDNTYDRNGNGLADDELSHVGIVVSASENGDVEFVHYNYSLGVVRARMNLSQPALVYADRGGQNTLINTPLRIPGWAPDRLRLTSELFHGAARLPEPVQP